VNPTSQPASPKYCIVGAGAIGGTIAAQLARANATVSIIDRGETVAAIQKDGLRLLINGETLQTSVRASADPAELGPQDYVIIAVKAPFLPEVASRIGPLLGPETAVVTAMNGIPWWFFTNAGASSPGSGWQRSIRTASSPARSPRSAVSSTCLAPWRRPASSATVPGAG
jgi:ketopantoate reductase